MAYQELEYEDYVHLPDNLTCIVESSHSAKKNISTVYLGEVVDTTAKTIVSMEIFTKTDEEAEEFFIWFNETLVYGTQPFTALHEIFGDAQYYVLQITDGIEEKILGGDNRKIKFTAEIVGVSYPTYSLNSSKYVIADGSIQCGVTPYNPSDTVTFVADNFDIILNSAITIPVSTATKTDNILYVTPTYPITTYPIIVSLVHNVQEQGLGIFDETIINDSEVERVDVHGTCYCSSDGQYIYIPLERPVNTNIWDTSGNFIISADDEDLITTIDTISNSNLITIQLPVSRPVYQYEDILVSFISYTNVDINRFTNVSITNNSIISSPEENTVVNASISAEGDLTIASMTIPQDRTYDADNTKLKLNGVEYDVTSVEQSAATLSVENSFLVTDYVSTVTLEHNVIEWGFEIGSFAVTNNSTVPRILVTDAYTNDEGSELYLVLDRVTGRNAFDAWIGGGGILGSLSLTADGVGVSINTGVLTGPIGTTYRINLNDGVYGGELLLLTFGDSTDIELAPFTNQSVTNNSQITEAMSMVSATISTDGLTITGVMSESSTYSYTVSNFEIQHGYLTIQPTSVEQIGTTLTITLASALRDNTVVLVDHLALENSWGIQTDIATTNNSTVNAPELSSSQVVTSGTYILVTMDEVLKAHSWELTDFVVEVNSVAREVVSVPYSIDGSSNIWIYTQGTIIDTDTVTLAFSDITDPQVYPFTATTVTNNSTVTSPTVTPPIYNMTEALVLNGGYSYLYNSSSSGSIYNGKLIHVGDGSNAAETPFTPSNAQYSEEGWIDLGNRPSGDGTKYINTGWIAPPTSVWSIGGVYDVVAGISYKMYMIHYKGNYTCDIYLYNSGDTTPTTPTFTNVAYTPPTETWKIYEYPPSIINVPTEIEYNMSTFNTI